MYSFSNFFSKALYFVSNIFLFSSRNEMAMTCFCEIDTRSLCLYIKSQNVFFKRCFLIDHMFFCLFYSWITWIWSKLSWCLEQMLRFTMTWVRHQDSSLLVPARVRWEGCWKVKMVQPFSWQLSTQYYSPQNKSVLHDIIWGVCMQPYSHFT